MSRQFGGQRYKQNDKNKTIILFCLVFLVFFMGIGVFILYSSGKDESPMAKNVVVEKEPQIDMTDVLIPIQIVDSGALLEPAMFRVEKRPKVGLSSRVVKSFEEINGYYARSTIAPDQPLHGDYITKVKPNSSVTANIPEGYRAVTIRVDVRSSVEGWARPGARVDVVWATTIRGDPAVTTIVQNAKVLSAERQTDSNQPVAKDGQQVGTPNTVTLLVTSQDAAKIQLASTSGSLSLSLRGDADSKLSDSVNSITIKDLLEKGKKEEIKKDGTVRVKRADGKYEEYYLKDGKLSPNL
jgi:pilus assembly protein CpaB